MREYGLHTSGFPEIFDAVPQLRANCGQTMILVGNQRGGGKDLANHLMKEENELVTVHDVRGFASTDLHGAFQESYAISRATHCKQHLYSLSLNPPKGSEVSSTQFEDAVNRAEDRLGLTGQPRAIVFHEKIGADGERRRHAHAVWCRIDTEDMKAVQMSHDHRKLNDVSRELYLKHDWTMPKPEQSMNGRKGPSARTLGGMLHRPRWPRRAQTRRCCRMRERQLLGS